MSGFCGPWIYRRAATGKQAEKARKSTDYRVRKRATQIAVKTVTKWLEQNPDVIERVIFNVFKDEDKKIYEKLI